MTGKTSKTIFAALLLSVCGTSEPPHDSGGPCLPLSNAEYGKGKLLVPPGHTMPDTLMFEIVIPKSMYMNSNRIGFHYNLIKRYSDWSGIFTDIRPFENDSSHWEKLMDRRLDMIMLNSLTDTVPPELEKHIMSGEPTDSEHNCWLCLKDRHFILENMMMWFKVFSTTDTYRQDTERFMKDYNSMSGSCVHISPYDSIIRECSAKAGLDWRLVAAVIRKESRFFIGVMSSRGATGLMQIKQDIADMYGIGNIYDPEENITAGTLYLKDIAERLRKDGVPEDQIYSFMLASFNAGEARIADCRRFTGSLGLDPDRWEDVASAIPLMRDKEHYEGEHIRLGRFNGQETLAYVEEVMSSYRLYCSMMPD